MLTGLSDSIHIPMRFDLAVMLRGLVDEFVKLGAPESDSTQARQHAEGFMEAVTRLNDWREQNDLTLPKMPGVRVGD